MPTLDSYLFFDGNCAQAMRFYEQTLGGKMEAMMRHSDAPASGQTPPGMEDRIMHACLVVDGRMLMTSDWMVGQPYPGKHGFALSLNYPDVPQARKIFDALAQGGQVTMPFQKTFWSEGFGMLSDRFGTHWMVSAPPATA